MELYNKNLTDRFVRLVEQLYFQLRSHPMEVWSQVELTIPQLRALLFLSNGPKRMSEIATQLNTVLSSATAVMNALVDKGLVERLQNPNDRRVVLCRLTSFGQEEVEDLWHIRRTRVKGIADLLTPQELEAVVGALETLASAAEREAPVHTSDTARGDDG